VGDLEKGKRCMKWRLFAGIAAILVGPSALAGLIDEGLSAEEAHQIKRLAIVSGLGDAIHGSWYAWAVEHLFE
jgi:hypothetical protein